MSDMRAGGRLLCGNEYLERIHILELDSKIRLDVCDECRAYLKTYTDEDEVI